MDRSYRKGKKKEEKKTQQIHDEGNVLEDTYILLLDFPAKLILWICDVQMWFWKKRRSFILSWLGGDSVKTSFWTALKVVGPWQLHLYGV